MNMLGNKLPFFLLAGLMLLGSGCVEDVFGDFCPDGEGAMIRITNPALGFDFYIDQYEASRSDATADFEGERFVRACSRAGVLPWRNVSYNEAQLACENAGKRLCTREEWVETCRNFNPDNAYTYGGVFREGRCNYALQNPDVVPTGSFGDCWSVGNRVFDMNGNVREWVSPDTVGGSPRLMGGAFSDDRLNVGCEAELTPAADYAGGRGDGFRCCR